MNLKEKWQQRSNELAIQEYGKEFKNLPKDIQLIVLSEGKRLVYERELADYKGK
ncbi:MAG: hypothetical protein KAU20_05730 [Nanoarchaeota archaeon]|nr:hypothetical protein [Nanoarchaeota archaeon]